MAVSPSDLRFPAHNYGSWLVKYAARVVSAFILNSDLENLWVCGKHPTRDKVSIKISDIQLVTTILQLVGYKCSPVDVQVRKNNG